jgi:hypothetical protein
MSPAAALSPRNKESLMHPSFGGIIAGDEEACCDRLATMTGCAL